MATTYPRARMGIEAGADDLRRHVLAVIRTAAPFAYCDACLALRCNAAPAELTAILRELSTAPQAPLARTRRVCYGCGRALELCALAERAGPS
jgi:hypothetical protein